MSILASIRNRHTQEKGTEGRAIGEVVSSEQENKPKSFSGKNLEGDIEAPPKCPCVPSAPSGNFDTEKSCLPIPIPCPICDCPAIWFSVYEPETARCCDCEPPPGGNDAWHFQRGGWAFVRRRLMLVVDTIKSVGADGNANSSPTLPEHERWYWESFNKFDWLKNARD